MRGPSLGGPAEGGAGLGRGGGGMLSSGVFGTWEGGCPGSRWLCQPEAPRMVWLKLWESLVWGWAVEGDMGGAGCVRKSTESEEG